MKPILERSTGRRLFGAAADDYERYRPAYPAELYAVLRQNAGLAPGISLFEVGPGTGQASRDLLADKPGEYLAIEPDSRMAALLEHGHAAPGFSVQTVPFEQAELPAAHFDLGVAAMSFHWVKEDQGLAKAAQALKPAGAFAMWWTQFDDSASPDAFHRAAEPVLADVVASPASAHDGRPHHSADREARLAALKRAFLQARFAEFPWTLDLSASALKGLFSTFSPILALPPEKRENTLDALERLARKDFHDRVVRQVTTRLYYGVGPRPR